MCSNNYFKINRKVIDKEFVKIQIARKTAKKNMHSKPHHKYFPVYVYIFFSTRKKIAAEE